jgi:hypothetical protein
VKPCTGQDVWARCLETSPKGVSALPSLVHGFRVGSSDFIYLVTAQFDHLYNLNITLVLVIHAAWRADWLPPPPPHNCPGTV